MLLRNGASKLVFSIYLLLFFPPWCACRVTAVGAVAPSAIFIFSSFTPARSSTGGQGGSQSRKKIATGWVAPEWYGQQTILRRRHRSRSYLPGGRHGASRASVPGLAHLLPRQCRRTGAPLCWCASCAHDARAPRPAIRADRDDDPRRADFCVPVAVDVGLRVAVRPPPTAALVVVALPSHRSCRPARGGGWRRLAMERISAEKKGMVLGDASARSEC